MKRILIITVIIIACCGGLYACLTWGSNGNPRFMHHKYNKVITEPLAKLGFSDAQYKMGLFWLYGSGESEPTQAEIENAVYWFEKASAKGNEDATKELAKLKESQLSIKSESIIVYPSKEVEDIDNELYRLLSDAFYNYNDEDKYNLFISRLKYHLADSLTFNNDLPKTSSQMKILRTPDGKYKFYSFDDGTGGTVRSYRTYIQFINSKGNLVSKLFDEEKYNDPSNFPMELFTRIWQFKHKNTDYYVAQKYCGTSVERQYSIEIFTISDGKPTYHTEFYPKGVSQTVCYSMNQDHEIDFDFNPQTLTVSYTTYENDYQSEGKQIKGSWKLALN